MSQNKNTVLWMPFILGAFCTLALMGCADTGNTEVLATETPCPPWTDFPADKNDNNGSPYLGCSGNLNLVNMLDKPSDLETGRALGPASGEREALAVREYNQNKNASFANPNAPTAIPIMLGASASGGSGQ